MSNLQIAQLERQIEGKKAQVALNNALERLKNNKDFKKVVMEGFFQTEAVRLVSVKGDPDMQTPERQASIIRDIDAIGSLQRYFRLIESNAEIASDSISDDEETLDAINAEALEDKGAE
jgi:hypothetical protein